MERNQTMAMSDQLKAAVLSVASWAWSLTDVCPPYYVAKGKLEVKRESTDGRLLFLVSGAWISVDRPTFELLSVGDHLRVRYTRRVRAISIDRHVDSNGR